MNSYEFKPSPLESATFDKIPTPMVAIDRRGIITFANIRALDDFDHSLPEAVINSDFRNFLSKEDQDRLPEITKQFIKAHVKLSHGGKSENIDFPEVKIKTVSGKERYIRLTPKIVRSEEKDKTKHIIGTEIFITDITEEVRARALAEAIRIVGESKLSKEDVLRKVRTILKSVVPHDTANLMLFDDLTDQLTLTVRDKWGYGDEGEPKTIDFTKTIKIEDKPLLRQMLISQQSLAVPNTETEEKYIKTVQEPINRSWIGAPLCIEIKGEKKVIGFLNLNNTKGYQYDASDEKTLMTFADQIAIAFKKSHKYEEKYRQATIDSLTQVHNRAYLFDEGEREFKRATRPEHPYHLTVMMTDGDNFKRLNDHYGHLTGDKIIRGYAQRSKVVMRSEDIFARYGGEEFTAVMPYLDYYEGFTASERVRQNIADYPIAFTDEHDEIKATASIGFAVIDQKIDKNFDDILARADEALKVVKDLTDKNAIGIHLPSDKVSLSIGKDVERPEQVIVFRKKKTEENTKKNVIGNQEEIISDYWEVSVFKKGKKTSEEQKNLYSLFSKYNVYESKAQEGDAQEITYKYIYRLSQEDQLPIESNSPVASLKSGQGAYLFDGGKNYHDKLDNNLQPNDSFAWVEILYPLKKSIPNDNISKLIRLF